MVAQRDRLSTRTEHTAYMALLTHVRLGCCPGGNYCTEGRRLHDHWLQLQEAERAAAPRQRRRGRRPA